MKKHVTTLPLENGNVMVMYIYNETSFIKIGASVTEIWYFIEIADRSF